MRVLRSGCVLQRGWRLPMPMPRRALSFRFVPGLLLAVSLTTTGPRAVAAPLFAARFVSFDAGSSPRSVAIGDLNGDGKPDLGVATEISLTVSVVVGNGE